MSGHIKLPAALALIRAKAADRRARHLNVICDYGLDQFRIFLEAYLDRAGIDCRMLPEEYGGLTKKLFGRPDERLFGTLVVIDSCSVGAAYSIRRLSDYQLPSGPDSEANLAQIVEAVRFYARHVDAPIFVLPLDIGFDPLVDTPGPLQSVQQERWTTRAQHRVAIAAGCSVSRLAPHCQTRPGARSIPGDRGGGSFRLRQRTGTGRRAGLDIDIVG